jgi:hypothetical protein
VKTIDLRQQQVSLDELLRSVGDDVVRITSKDGDEFVLEPANAFEREANELGQSERFMAFLAERSAEHGRISLADVESRLAGAESTSRDPGTTAESEQGSTPHRSGPDVPPR